MKHGQRAGDREQQSSEAAAAGSGDCQPGLGPRAEPGGLKPHTGADLEQPLPRQAQGTQHSVINVPCFIFPSPRL